MLKYQIILAIICFIIASTMSFSQQHGTLFELNSNFKKQTITQISELLNNNYVFQETAKKMSDFLISKLQNGAYESINDPMIFADILTDDIQSISNDKHLRVSFSPEDAKRLLELEKSGTDPDDEKHFNEILRDENYGFKQVEILPGNIGYVDFRVFASPDYSKETIASVMGFLANTDVLIFDLRSNRGGQPPGVQLLCSYLFGDEPVHLNDQYSRKTDDITEYWTLNNIAGKKMPDVPVYVLTSKFTFSGAEEFAYDLKNLKRATIIGETTGGGANSGGMKPVNEVFEIFIPNKKAINPVTKTNWEGVGVTPDIEIKSELALKKAQILALETLKTKTIDHQKLSTYNWMIGSYTALLYTPDIEENIMKSYSGTYNDRTITFENGKLYYQRNGRQKYEMIPMSDDTFMFKDLEHFRIRFIKDASGNSIELNGLYDDGHEDRSKRTD